MSHRIDVLLATFNGGSFLEDQLDSLFVQTFNDWRLLVRDDGSSDETLHILHKYQKRYPDKITLIQDTMGRLGPARSFEYLARCSEAPYIAFCDQDDIWAEDKLQLQMETMAFTENEQSEQNPVLIHSDLLVIDKQGRTLAPSFWRYQKLKPQTMNRLERLLVQNYVTGCTVIINRVLLERALPIPDKAIMHDWWLALHAVSSGQIVDLEKVTVKYRQHGNNDIGAKKWNLRHIFKTAILEHESIRKKLYKTHNQAMALLASGKLNSEGEKIVGRYLEMFTENWLSKRFIMIRMGFFKYGIVRNLAMLVFL